MIKQFLALILLLINVIVIASSNPTSPLKITNEECAQISGQIEAINDLITMTNTHISGFHQWDPRFIEEIQDTSYSNGYIKSVDAKTKAINILFFITLKQIQFQPKMKYDLCPILEEKDQSKLFALLMQTQKIISRYEQGLSDKTFNIYAQNYEQLLLIFHGKLSNSFEIMQKEYSDLFNYYYYELSAFKKNITQAIQSQAFFYKKILIEKELKKNMPEKPDFDSENESESDIDS